MPARDAALAVTEQLKAAAALVAALRNAEDLGTNLVARLLMGRPFVAFERYPAEDVLDRGTGAQYYFHAHDDNASARKGGWSEAGHIHCFMNPEGNGVSKPMHHLVAIAMNRFGRPVGLFTVNRWVTDENWVPADVAIRLARRFALADPAPESRFVTAMYALFRAEVETLLAARDSRIAAWRRDHPDRDALEDRALEITSVLKLDLEAKLATLRAHVEGGEPVVPVHDADREESRREDF